MYSYRRTQDRRARGVGEHILYIMLTLPVYTLPYGRVHYYSCIICIYMTYVYIGVRFPQFTPRRRPAPRGVRAMCGGRRGREAARCLPRVQARVGGDGARGRGEVWRGSGAPQCP